MDHTNNIYPYIYYVLNSRNSGGKMKPTLSLSNYFHSNTKSFWKLAFLEYITFRKNYGMLQTPPLKRISSSRLRGYRVFQEQKLFGVERQRYQSWRSSTITHRSWRGVHLWFLVLSDGWASNGQRCVKLEKTCLRILRLDQAYSSSSSLDSRKPCGPPCCRQSR